MKTVSVDELKELIDAKANFQLIDVREIHEYEMANIGGELIPMQTVPEHLDKITKDKKLVVMCRSGKRSANVVNFLEQQGYDNAFNLEGGILDWKAEIDNSLDVD